MTNDFLLCITVQFYAVNAFQYHISLTHFVVAFRVSRFFLELHFRSSFKNFVYLKSPKFVDHSKFEGKNDIILFYGSLTKLRKVKDVT